MDRAEAVKRIKEIQKLYVFTPTINEALDLAIQALEGGTEEEVDYCNNCPYISWDKTDCISRADTVRAMCLECNVVNKCDVWNCGTEDLCTDVEIVMSMPPVNQKQITSKLESVENATSESEESTMNQPKSKLESDLISRQEVIDYLNELLDGRYDAVKSAMIQGIRDNIRHLPPVTPQVSEDCISRQAVETISKEEVLRAIITCDTAGSSLTHLYDVIENMEPSVTPTERTGEWVHDGSDWENRWVCDKCGHKIFEPKTNFCPNCGADMRGDTE